MFTKTFFKLFPPPKFLDIPYAGIDISDSAIHCIEYASSKHGYSIHRYRFLKLEEGIIDSGNIKNKEVLIEKLSSLAKEMKISTVKASLPEERMYLFKTEVPTTDKRQIRQNIEFKLEENVPLSPSDAIFFFDIIPKSIKIEKPFVSVSVAPRELVNSYLDVFKSSGLTVVSFDIQAKALAKSVIPEERSILSLETQMIVHIMNKKTGIYIVCGGVVCFTSTVMWSGESIRDKQMSDITDQIFSLRQSIDKVYNYWTEHGEGQSINSIILSGKDALIISKIPHISPNEKIPIKLASVWINAFSSDHYIPPISFEDSLDYAVVAGLALP